MAFRDTDEAAAFIATADSRETSREIMQAIVFFARNVAEAEALWAGDAWGIVCYPTDMWEHVTNNGRIDPTDFCWGGAGAGWWSELERNMREWA